MTSKNSFLVFVALIASGSLIGACGDGEISAPRRSSVDEPTPDQLDVNEPAPGVTGVPYGHVTPADVGVTIGVGVVAPVPTEVYTGPTTITSNGTTIENKVINNDTIFIQASNVTIRNCIVNSSTDLWTFRVGEPDDPTIDNILIEYMDITNTEDGKMFNVNNATNLVMRNSVVQGGLDFHFMNRELDGFLSENNYYHNTVSSGGHTDGWQIGSGSGDNPVTTGTITMRGNYIDVNTNDEYLTQRTDLLFGAGSPSTNQTTIVMENNFLNLWGYYTLRCTDPDACIVRNNVYEQRFKTVLPASSGPGIPNFAAQFKPHNVGGSTYECNRYEDGSFIEDQYIACDGCTMTHDTTGCPSY